MTKENENIGIKAKRCAKCGAEIKIDTLKREKYICPVCGGYFCMPARERIIELADEKTFEEKFEGGAFFDPIKFPGYAEKYEKAKETSGEKEGVICGKCLIGGQETCIYVMEPGFMMGSMGSVVGERITALFEYATKNRLPVIGYTVSGGARMQEGIYSLMQMAKTTAAVRRHGESGLFYLVCLTNPTMGGITASFASLGDVIIAEPEAQIGFAGRKVVEQLSGKTLSDDFRKSEKVLGYGFLDKIVERKDQKKLIADLLETYSAEKRSVYGNRLNEEMEREKKPFEYTDESLKAYERVRISRKSGRPTAKDYIYGIFESFCELHGDRKSGDDTAVIGGIAKLNGKKITVIGTEKGRTAEERVKRNFGMANASGYRKAIRLMKLAEKFSMPVMTIIDTQGAECGEAAERSGIGQAIAESISGMSALRVPIISLIIGEAGSGGALGLAYCDKLIMLENAYYSVITPEACSKILYGDTLNSKETAEFLGLTASELKKEGIVDIVLKEPQNYSDSESRHKFMNGIKILLEEELEKLQNTDKEKLSEMRYFKYRNIGITTNL